MVVSHFFYAVLCGMISLYDQREKGMKWLQVFGCTVATRRDSGVRQER